MTIRTTRSYVIGLVIAAALLAAAPTVASADFHGGAHGPRLTRADWPIYGHDLANSRDAGAQGPPAGDAGSIKQAWSFHSSTGDFTGTPVVARGVLVAGNNGGWVYALKASTGQALWSRDIGQPINGSAAIDPRAAGGGLVLVPVAQLGSPRLAALSLKDGTVRWDVTLTSQAGADIYGSPTYWRGTAYIGTSANGLDESTARGSVVAVDEQTGRLRWQTFTVPEGDDGGGVWSTPAIDTRTGRLIVGTGNAYHLPAADTTDSILTLDSATGRIVHHWQANAKDTFDLGDNPCGDCDYDLGASPNLITGPHGQRLVGEGSKNGFYYALDRDTLHLVWHTSIGRHSLLGGILGSTAYDGSHIYAPNAYSGRVWALDVNGTASWSSVDHGQYDLSPVATANGVLYTVDPTGSLVARDASTGAVLNTLPLGGPSYGGVSIAHGTIYAAVGTGPLPDPTVNHPGSIIAFRAVDSEIGFPASSSWDRLRPLSGLAVERLSNTSGP